VATSLCPDRRLSFMSERAIPPVPDVGLVVFASTLFTRAVYPVIPHIAVDLAIDAKTAALLSTAYTFPYALIQPLLGALSDTLGKTRVMNVALLVVALAALISSVVTDFYLLVAMRVMARDLSPAECFPPPWRSSAILFRFTSGRSRSAACLPSASPATCSAPRSRA
jgi:MFS family permease